MRNWQILHRMFRNSLLVLLVFTAIGVVWTFIPTLGTTGFGSGFAPVFVIGGLVWLVVAYLSGGFVSTYVAPGRGAGNPLLYTLPGELRTDIVLPKESPEVMADLQQKMGDQTGPMVVAFLKGLAFFGLAGVFSFAPWAGVAVLAGVLALFAGLFFVSRPRRQPAALQ